MRDKNLLMALDMLTAGDQGASIPESLGAEAVAVKKEHRSWVDGEGMQGFGIAKK